MGIIAIEGMRFQAYHGYYPEEQILGTEYLVDVYITVNTSSVSKSDKLADTVNYETIFRISKGEMSINSKLIETVAQRIIDRIKSLFGNIEELKIRISKLNPPLGSTVTRTFIELHEDYRSKCGKCKKNILVQNEGDCWTKYGRLFDETKLTLFRNFGNNLCKSCLQPYIAVKNQEED
jgi:7,8-dihydroneopterin aldolase/epimerase/oxygenase